MKIRPLPSLIQDFLNAEVHHLSPSTQRAYTADLMAYGAWLSEHAFVETPDRVQHYLQDAQTWRPATRARKKAVLLKFYTWAASAQARSMDFQRVMQRVSLPVAPPKTLPIDHASYQQVISSIPHSHQRDLLLFRLMAEAGLRLGEIQDLKVNDVITKSEGQMMLSARFRGRERKVLLAEDVAGLLESYLKQRGLESLWLFPALWNGRVGALRQSTIHSLWRRYAAPLGVEASAGQLYQLALHRELHQSLRLHLGLSVQSPTVYRKYRRMTEAAPPMTPTVVPRKWRRSKRRV